MYIYIGILGVYKTAIIKEVIVKRTGEPTPTPQNSLKIPKTQTPRATNNQGKPKTQNKGARPKSTATQNPHLSRTICFNDRIRA